MASADTPMPPTVRSAAPTEPNIGAILGGLALLLPLTILWLVALVRPTWQTFALSRQNVRPGSAARTPAGFDNYRRMVDDPLFAIARDFTTMIAIERLLVVAIVPLLLALALNEFGRAVRLPLRVLFSAPLALFAPVSVALMWRFAYDPQFGIFADNGSPLTRVNEARGALLRMDGFATFGLACALGLIVYLAAARGGGMRPWKPLLVTWLITLCATVALAVQNFTPSYVLTSGGPSARTTTLALLSFQQAFQQLRLGQGAAVNVLILIVPALLGLVVAILVAASGLRLMVVPATWPTGLLAAARKPTATLALVVLALGSVGLYLYGLLPTFWTGLASFKTPAEAIRRSQPLFPSDPTFAAYRRVAELIHGGQTLTNTALPVLITVLLLQLPLAYLAALGIGALRPLGRWSEWLLLPFGPWLFVTALPLGVANYDQLARSGGLNRFTSLIPPPTLALPMLFVLTLCFKGQANTWRAARAAGEPTSFVGTVILPSLPLAALLALAGLLLGMQELFWPLLAATTEDLQTVTVALMRLRGETVGDVPLIAAAIFRYGFTRFLLFLLIFALFQIFYLDRLALATGRDNPPAPPPAAR